MILRYEFILYFSCCVKTTILTTLTTLIPTSFMKYFFMLTLLYKKIKKYDKNKKNKSVFLYVNQILNKNVCVFLTKTINKNKNDFSYVSKIQKIDFCFLAFVDCP